MNAPQLPPDAVKQAQAARRVVDAYASVFGLPEARSEAQKLVMDDIEGFCHAFRPCVELRTDGSIAKGNHKVNEGKRLVWMHIRGAIITSQLPLPGSPSISRKRKPPNPS